MPQITRPSTTVYGGSRPVTIQVPNAYDPNKKYPLAVILHNYGADGPGVQTRLRLDALKNYDNGVLVLAPNGTVDQASNQFWSASLACCDKYQAGPDDIGYLTSIIASASKDYPVDASRIYCLGYSNGAFMSHTMACSLSSVVCGIAVVAGAPPSTSSLGCGASVPVSVLHIHGTADVTVNYTGSVVPGPGTPGGPYLPATGTVTQWAAKNGIAGTYSEYATIDFDLSIAGNTTHKNSFANPPQGGAVELWVMSGSGHNPNHHLNNGHRMWGWLLDNHR